MKYKVLILVTFLFLLSCSNHLYAQVIDSAYNPVLTPSGGDNFDKYRVSNPVVLKDENDYKMYYIGLGDSNHIEIGGAVSQDGVSWTKFGNVPTFSCGENLLGDCQNNYNWSSYRVAVIDVIKEDSIYKMWYLGDSFNVSPPNFLGYATSSDGISWNAYSLNPIFPDFSSSRLEFQGVIKYEGKYLLYYRLNDGLGTYLATSSDGLDWKIENDGNPISEKYLLSPEVIGDVVYASEGGVLFESNDGFNFTLNGIRVVPESVNDFTGTLLVNNDLLHIWYSNVTSNYLNGIREVVINYATSTIIPEGNSSVIDLYNLTQKRIDGKTDLTEGASFVGNGVVFGAEVGQDDEGVARALEVEVKPMEEMFDGSDTHISKFSTDSLAQVRVVDFLKGGGLYQGENSGNFKWRARGIDENDIRSEWVEFGDDDTDFSIVAVPLITQVASPYPNETDTASWSTGVYAGGRADKVGHCGSTIESCGCVLSSLSTLGYHHGITTAIDGSTIDPKNLNDWLLANNGYTGNGSIIWPEAMKYFGEQAGSSVAKTRFGLSGHKVTDRLRIQSKLDSGEPVVAYSSPQGYRHYYVIDSLLDTGFEISDPYWFATGFSDEERSVVNNIQDYDDVYTAAQIIDVTDTSIAFRNMIEIHLASPAELVVRDQGGKRVGYNPKNGKVYEEIEGGQYDYETSIYSGNSTRTDAAHMSKVVRIFDAEPGLYKVSVVGTDPGEYLLSIYTIDEKGNSTLVEYSDTIKENKQDIYSLDFVTDELIPDHDKGHGNDRDGCDEDNPGKSRRCSY